LIRGAISKILARPTLAASPDNTIARVPNAYLFRIKEKQEMLKKISVALLMMTLLFTGHAFGQNVRPKAKGRRRHANTTAAMTKGEVSLAVRNRRQKHLHRRRGRH
jgi:hypothetical protein